MSILKSGARTIENSPAVHCWVSDGIAARARETGDRYISRTGCDGTRRSTRSNGIECRHPVATARGSVSRPQPSASRTYFIWYARITSLISVAINTPKHQLLLYSLVWLLESAARLLEGIVVVRP